MISVFLKEYSQKRIIILQFHGKSTVKQQSFISFCGCVVFKLLQNVAKLCF